MFVWRSSPNVLRQETIYVVYDLGVVQHFLIRYTYEQCRLLEMPSYTSPYETASESEFLDQNAVAPAWFPKDSRPAFRTGDHTCFFLSVTPTGIFVCRTSMVPPPDAEEYESTHPNVNHVAVHNSSE